jgi:hypothetical protein
MTTLAASQYDRQFQSAIVFRQAIQYEEKAREEQGMISSSGDLIRYMWSILQSETSSALDWFRKCTPMPLSSFDLSVLEDDYEPYTAEEPLILSVQYLEPEEDSLVGPPEHAWKTLEVEFIPVELSPLDL